MKICTNTKTSLSLNEKEQLTELSIYNTLSHPEQYIFRNISITEQRESDLRPCRKLKEEFHMKIEDTEKTMHPDHSALRKSLPKTTC